MKESNRNMSGKIKLMCVVIIVSIVVGFLLGW